MKMVAIKDMEMPSCCENCNMCDNKNLDTFYCCITLNDVNIDEKAHDCPLVEIEERKVGKWIVERDDYGELTRWHCSNCYDKTGFFTTCAWDYCPNCGADMRGSENE